MKHFFFCFLQRLLLLLAVSGACLLPAQAQTGSVGIGTTLPDASAALDIVSTSRGLLLPRVAATSNVNSPATGLVVYQTGSPAGFYYYDGAAWQQLVPASSGSFVRNQPNPQAGASFNVDGNGTVGGGLAVGGALTGSGADVGAVVGVGVRADGGLNLGQNTSGNSVFLGYQAGQSSTGHANLFVGYQAGASNTTGINNTFSGSSSGASNTTGTNNVFTGYLSGTSNTTAFGNTFSGTFSGRSNTTGGGNVFSGYQSGVSNTTGINNTFSGSTSGVSNTTGTNNVFSGSSSGNYNTTGSSNTALGYGAGPGSGNLVNTTALGNGAIASTNNTVHLGNTAVTTIEGQVAYSFPSDARFKYQVQANVPGLAFINRLRPVTYRFDSPKLERFTRTGVLSTGCTPDSAAAVQTGFLAQEVERAAHGLGYRFDGVHVPTDARDHYSLAYSQFVMPLVQAVQELSAEVETLKTRNAALQQQNAADHASLLTMQAQLARLLGADTQAQK
ncbi:tail fiber domain-containing protein [Hymenobacter baengnokdamensis]|uniref:tail fiber domain-containing protein n=1 Tax=Hymenobacter baengnokdamensis TaxID=2615203 RepID=UPI001246EA52|nr:tail fiber domain-containing protein [Hymenobacter baengnokdamensis]